MKPIDGNKQPSYKDPINDDGDRLYYCAKCQPNGYAIPSNQVATVFDVDMVSKGAADTAGRRTGLVICPQCNAEVGSYVGGKIVFVGIVK